MRKVTLSIFAIFLTCALYQMPAKAQVAPVFTGNATADFLSVPGYTYYNDFVQDVGLPAAAPNGTQSGWDMKTVFFYHDAASDDLYVGIDFAGIFSDADGNGDPSGTSSWLSSLSGTDHANMSNTEGFVLAFDLEGDGMYDVYIGVSREDQLSDFGVFLYSSSMDEAPESFPAAAAGAVNLHSANPNFLNQDLEFKVSNISNYIDNLCGVDFSIFAGSYEDGPIGEDYMYGTLEVCSLPVELVSFKSKMESRRTLLEWVTETEENNDYFELQHATDANSDFVTIARINGNGTTNAPVNYEAYHDSPIEGNNYYRLKQVDFDGTEWFSWVITQNYQGANGAVIEVYPNPNKGEFTLGLPKVKRETDATMRIIDNRGRTITEAVVTLTEGLTSYPINVSSLYEGMYHVSLTLLDSQNTYNTSFMIR